jgi:hypothetical protein
MRVCPVRDQLVRPRASESSWPLQVSSTFVAPRHILRFEHWKPCQSFFVAIHATIVNGLCDKLRNVMWRKLIGWLDGARSQLTRIYILLLAGSSLNKNNCIRDLYTTTSSTSYQHRCLILKFPQVVGSRWQATFANNT